MIKKVMALTKIFIKDFYQNTKLTNRAEKKLNKKSVLFWILIVLSIALTYVSYHVIKLLISAGVPEVFLTIFMMFLSLLILYQIAFISTNVFFFSKDLEFVLPLPINSKELLLAKFNTVLIMTYIMELGFGLIPLTLYGFMNFTTFFYFVWMLLALILLPIAFVAVFGLIAVVLMRILSFIRNKVILQNIIAVILILFLFLLENQILGDIQSGEENNIFVSFLTGILVNTPISDKLLSIGLLILLDIFAIGVFIFFGEKIYLKTVLKSISSATMRWKKETKEIKIKPKKTSVGYSYIKKEIKMLFKKPVFFMQTVFPVIILLITLIMIANVFIPMIDASIQKDETIKQSLASLEFNAEMIFVILGVIQFLYSISTVSLTAISREGRSAIFMKYIPLSLYKQFLYKNVIQVVLNVIVSVVTLSLTYYYVPEITLMNIILLWVISMFINLINSYVMLILDLRRPYLNWTSEHSVIKRNDNKSFQYAFMIVMMLLLMYISTIFKELNATFILGIEIAIFATIFIILNIIVKKNINKLFNKIM